MSRPQDGAPWPTAATRPVALLGWPVAQSLSPVIHNAAFREQDLDLVYLALPCPPEALRRVVTSLGEVGGVGANVTVPHKQDVVALCDRQSPEAELIGAVNTLCWDADGLFGDNTDAVGLADALRADVAVAAGDRLVLLGTGGAARAAVVAAGRLGCRLTVVGRRPDAAAALAELGERAGASDPRAVDVADGQAVARAVGEARIVMNTTPLGLRGEDLPAAFHGLHPGQVAYDLLYPRTPSAPGVEPTPFLQAARERGAEAFHGLGMLVGQAAASYERWTGMPAPVEVMSAAALAALTHRS
ncbi:shikimate dehydrogenase [Egicoccus sp. AB-alg6-2]|uniref:shikimate dehydrogenase n=1 Tax=Egicoccus sp. AB-alg6-2 TaxID=3242692 RepID=UPI00359E78E4